MAGFLQHHRSECSTFILRHKAPHIKKKKKNEKKKEELKEVATEGGAGCEQIVVLSR